MVASFSGLAITGVGRLLRTVCGTLNRFSFQRNTLGHVSTNFDGVNEASRTQLMNQNTRALSTGKVLLTPAAGQEQEKHSYVQAQSALGHENVLDGHRFSSL